MPETSTLHASLGHPAVLTGLMRPREHHFKHVRVIRAATRRGGRGSARRTWQACLVDAVDPDEFFHARRRSFDETQQDHHILLSFPLTGRVTGSKER